jgi:hypothetical protein
MSDDTVWKPSYHEDTTMDVREPRHLAGQYGGDTPTVESSDLAVRDPDGVDLFEDPFQDDLNARLAAAAPRKLANRATLVIAALVIAVVGFIAGAQVQKSYGTSSAAGNGGGARGGFPTSLPSGFSFNRGAGGGAGTGTGGTTARGITGTVKLVDGTTVYVEEADGTVITVKTSDTTTVLAPGALKDLAAGASVTVQGQNDNGTVTATSITKTK